VDARVKRISIAPVKALGLVHPEAVELGCSGVVGDRRLWLVTPGGRLVNGKTHPRLMQVRPVWDERTRRLALRFPSGELVDGIVEPGEPVEARLYGEAHPARAVPGQFEDALSAFAGEPLRLLWSEGGAVDRGGIRGWATLVSQASLEQLRQAAGAERPVDGRRFRMLLEIAGVGSHEEDAWIGARVRVGEAVLEPVGDVGRCVVTTCDPDTGVSDLDTLGALAGYRRNGRNEPLPLGVYCAVAEPGRVRVGDPVTVVESAVVG
jgi:uncharacterized protein YcbX